MLLTPSALGAEKAGLQTRAGRGGVAACPFIPPMQTSWAPPRARHWAGCWVVVSRAKGLLIDLL